MEARLKLNNGQEFVGNKINVSYIKENDIIEITVEKTQKWWKFFNDDLLRVSISSKLWDSLVKPV